MSKKLKGIANNISRIMEEKDDIENLKSLSEISSISYPSLTPILQGTRDFGVTKLIELSNALNCDPNDKEDATLASSSSLPVDLSDSTSSTFKSSNPSLITGSFMNFDGITTKDQPTVTTVMQASALKMTEKPVNLAALSLVFMAAGMMFVYCKIQKKQ